MALQIGTNSSSLAAQRSLITSQSNLQTSFERLSSGSRINSAADDAAGLSIASRLKAQASGLQVAQRNAANGISLVETADAALGTMTDLLTRGRDLVLQYSDGTLSTSDKSAIDAELADINTELDRVRTKSTFAGVNLLDGSFPDGAEVSNLGTGVSIAIDAAGTTVSVALDSTLGGYSFTTGNESVGDSAAAAGDAAQALTNATTVATFDTYMNAVNKARAEFGALANTFQSAIENLAAVEQGVTAAAGRIMDTDFARESAELAKNQILQQAGTSILAQANQSTQSVLSLLQ
ncbi:flagellin [Litorivicinus lipolyticus]|uniref:Flagellin n=1 Tax=Litorivicinus lipolyticus TaxID=418701 RepID=A0A5Q2QAF3_9GAMM|nr:flagellin [Litorivicinus lipolyticus]QGG80223.1 flagellin [Litorivicinus lipolyticus]